MADNTPLSPAAPGGPSISTEDIGGGLELPRGKLVTGGHGIDGGDVTPANPFPVQASPAQSAAGIGTLLTPSPLAGVALVTPPAGWRQASAPVGATQATTTLAAGAAGVRHVVTAITAALAAGAIAQTPLNVFLRDGLTGAGPILWAGCLAAPVDGSGVIGLAGLAIPGSPATAMTLEFSAAGLAGVLESVAMTGYDVA